jgi:hypothetical protein
MGGASIRHRGLRATLGLDGWRAKPTLEELFLARLARLAQLRGMVDLPLQQRRLVNLALYSTYWDCVRLGLRPTARQMLGLAGA